MQNCKIKHADFEMEYSSKSEKKKRQRFLSRRTCEYSATHIKRRGALPPFSLAEVYQAIDGKVAAAATLPASTLSLFPHDANDGRSTLSRCSLPPPFPAVEYR